MSGALPPLFIITDVDHAGYVAVTLYTLLVLMVLLVTTRIFIRWYVVTSFRLDDIFLMLGAVSHQFPLILTTNSWELILLAIVGSGGSGERFGAIRDRSWAWQNEGNCGRQRLCIVREGRSPQETIRVMEV